MKKVSENLRTNEQNRKLYWLFGQLNIRDADTIADIVSNFTNGRTCHTSELQFIECMELIKWLNDSFKSQQLTKSERIDGMDKNSDEYKKLDRNRKGLIKAIFRWYELRGMVVTMDYVKATACRAAGTDSFNKISPDALTRLYAEFCRKQKAAQEMSKDDFNICMN